MFLIVRPARVARTSEHHLPVLESRQVGAGVTGKTTAKVSVQHGLVHDSLGAERAMQYAAAQVRALDWMADEVATGAVDCGFERRDSYLYTKAAGRVDELASEVEAMQLAGLSAAQLLDGLDLPFEVAGAVRLPDQAQCHPLRWLLHLAEQIEADGGQVIEGESVVNVHERHGILQVGTATGSSGASSTRTVTAEHGTP